MNTPIQTMTRAASDHTADQPTRPALREALQVIATIAVQDETAVISDRSITFQNSFERTAISVEPINIDTIDRMRIAEIITIRTPLTQFKLFDEKDYSFINNFALTGAVMRDADGKDLIISRLPLFEGDEDTLANLYTPLIADAARLQLVGPLCGIFHFEGREEEYDAAVVGIPGWNEPSYWGSEEFYDAKERLWAQGAYANASDSGLTVGFPWEQGGVSAIAGDCVSLLQIRADQRHPAAGNGLFYRLDLPTDFSDEEAHEWAAKLNRAELGGVDTPPMFGAWCTRPRSGTVSFTGFWPNLMYKRGTVAWIAFWSWGRSSFARQVLGNLH